MTIFPEMSTVLITGFEPFGGEQVNASGEVALALAGENVMGRHIVGKVLPCVFGEAPRRLRQEILGCRPELVISLGEADGLDSITVEMKAANSDSARNPDNAGARPRGRVILPGGPTTRATRLPATLIVRELRRQHIPASLSWSAGRYVCNHLFYNLMQTLSSTNARRRVVCRGGFIHLPCLPRPGRKVSMDLGRMVRGIRLAIEVTLADSGPAVRNQVLKRKSATSPSRKT